MLNLSSHMQTSLRNIYRKCFYCSKATYSNNIHISNVKNNPNITRPKPMWSPLAVAFNSYPENKINFIRNPSGLFNIPELTSHGGFFLLKENVIHKSDELINEAISTNRSRKIVQIFDELSDSLCKVADLAEFIRLAHPNINYTTAAEHACISVSGVVEKLNTHQKLYKALSSVNKNGDLYQTTDIDKHVGQLFLFDFEQCGIHLPEKERKTVVYLNHCILQLGQKFMAGTVHPRSVSKNMLPESIRKYFMHEGDNILVSGLYADSSSSMAREAAYRLFLYPDHSQELCLKELLSLRYKLATICGFPTYGHRALKSSTVETPDVVLEFLNLLNDELHDRAKGDFQIMQKLKTDDTRSHVELGPWDTPYYTSKYKKEWMKVSTSEFMSYFSLGSCIDGLNNLMKSLYGIHWQLEDMRPGESWAPEVYKLNVIHETEGLLGHIYCDLYERAGKANQDCHFTIQGGKKLSDGTYQNPIVVVMLNLNPPRWNGPTLLSPAMVDNLFHEMGHAMHSMLARTEYQHVTGTRCSTDFAEVPSVLMEYFASDPRVLKTFARHFQTNEPMPEDMLMQLCASKNIFGASETQLQVFYSALDQVYHSEPINEKTSTTDILKEVQSEYYNIPYVKNTAWQLRFSHLVGYGAKYYSYLISRAIASWIWQTYFNEDPFCRINGEKYRHNCLSYGGCIPSRHLVSNFLQRDVTPSNLAKCLINEIDINNSKLNEINRKINGRDNNVS